MNHFDPDLLRTIIAFADTGSLVRAAKIVGRTPSAVTSQMQRLEECVGVALLEASGRNRTLTEAGERMVSHSRRILALSQEAWLNVTGSAAEGRVGLGVTQDFADSRLSRLLRRFAQSHPRIRIDLRVGRSPELVVQQDSGQIDIVIAMRQPSKADEVVVMSEPMRWLCSREGLVGPTDDLPLALLDSPCGFRDAALRAFDKSGRPHRIAATSTSLAGLRVAVMSGVAITARTERWADSDIVLAPGHLRLPELPKAEFSMTIRKDSQGPTGSLAQVLAEGLPL